MSLQISDLWPSKRQPAEPVARARLQALRLKLPGLKRAQQLAAVRLQLLSFFPTGPFAFAWRELAPGDVSVWAWALESTEDTSRRPDQQWPEILLETDGNGLHLLQRQPGFAPLREDLQRFLRMSSEQFFGGAAREADDGRWLLALARKCRDAERGLA